MKYCRVEQPVSLQEIHISKTGGSHCSPCFVGLFCGGSYGEQHVNSNSSSVPIRTSHLHQSYGASRGEGASHGGTLNGKTGINLKTRLTAAWLHNLVKWLLAVTQIY